MAKAEASVEELVGMIEHGELRLPEMQRQYVWRSTRVRFDLYISQVVLREAGGGDAKAARLRLEVLEGISVLALSPEASALAQQLLQHGPLPAKAAVDALHIGIAAVNGMD